jgi:hypothetical protein
MKNDYTENLDDLLLVLIINHWFEDLLIRWVCVLEPFAGFLRGPLWSLWDVYEGLLWDAPFQFADLAGWLSVCFFEEFACFFCEIVDYFLVFLCYGWFLLLSAYSESTLVVL